MAWDWLTPAISGLVGGGGLLFGWLSSKQSRTHTEALARESNQHALRMAREATRQALALEELRGVAAARDRHRDRLEGYYRDISMVVLRAGEAVNDAMSGPTGETRLSFPQEALTQARSTANLYFPSQVSEKFNAWYDRLAKVHYSLERQTSSTNELGTFTGVGATRETWRRQTLDARLREADARDDLMTALAEQVRLLVGQLAGPAGPGHGETG